MREQTTFSVSVSKTFVKAIWDEYIKLADKSSSFHSMLAKQTNKDGSKKKNINKGKASAYFRFAILTCYVKLKEEAIKRESQKEESEAVKETNNESEIDDESI